MAKYQITHRCGHTVDHNLTGNLAACKSQVEWRGRQDCDECGKAYATAAAKAANEANGLPALEGSEKQIAWAETIRAKFAREIDEAAADFRGRVETAKAEGHGTAKLDVVWAAVQSAVAAVRSESSAKQWIENQHRSGKVVFDEIVVAEAQRPVAAGGSPAPSPEDRPATLLDYINDGDKILICWRTRVDPEIRSYPAVVPEWEDETLLSLYGLAGKVSADGAWRWDGEGSPKDDRLNLITAVNACEDGVEWDRLVG